MSRAVKYRQNRNYENCNKRIYDGEGEYLPGEWCTFCRAAVRCRARAEEKLKLAQTEFHVVEIGDGLA